MLEQCRCLLWVCVQSGSSGRRGVPTSGERRRSLIHDLVLALLETKLNRIRSRMIRVLLDGFSIVCCNFSPAAPI